jgi:fructose-1,6-bisphosphatase/inositol monophosphatase family enzyme
VVTDLHDLRRRLEAAVNEAGKIAQDARAAGTRDLKPDGSIVTNGDRAAEAFLRPILTDMVPGSLVWGEEEGHDGANGFGEAGLWIVDPIDGTSNYAYGSPLWGVTAALVQGDAIVVGAMALPDLGESYSAALGQGATLNGSPLAPIPPGPIVRHELVGFCDDVLHAAHGTPIPGKMRCTGSFVVEGAFVATQRFRGLVGVGEKLYDVGTSVLIAQELGADVRYADGEPFGIGELARGGPIRKPWIIFPAGSGFAISSYHFLADQL